MSRHAHAVPGSRCRMIGCDFDATEYSDPRLRGRALGEHQATVHGIGRRPAAEAHLGCFYKDCTFKVSGSAKWTERSLRDHLIAAHGVDPDNPQIPADARRPEK